MTVLRVPVLLCVLIALLPGPVQAQVTARARLDSTEFLVGDPISVRLEVSHPNGASIRAIRPDTTEGFTVLEQSALEAKAPTASVGVVVFARYDSGQAAINPITILYTLPGDTAVRATGTNPLVVTTHTMRVDTSQAIRDLKPPLTIPYTLIEIAGMIAAVLAAAAIGWFGYRYWRRRRRRATGEEPSPPPRPAHIIALEALADLKARRLWQQGKIKEFYSEVTDILRRYIEHRYGIPALEETTDGIIDGLTQQRFRTDLLGQVDAMLRRADLVKFARRQPDMTEHEETFAIVHHVVEVTKVTTMTPPDALETHGSSHVGS